ncbi:class D sortase [Symbiobacterium thermophilum]|uniref:class D sortase n=1 Tax=Symbiobacterium thermophilum TaxID=2734 RepID=UPI0003058ACF|nr:class D sortase [Symbiobacterium thermophilum]
MVARYLPKALFLLGCLLVLVAGVVNGVSRREQARLMERYEREVAALAAAGGTAPGLAGLRPFAAAAPSGAPPALPEEGADTGAGLPAMETAGPEAGTGEESPDRADQAPGPEVIGILTIPKIDLTVAIAEGTDDRTLRHAVGHFAETAGPGEPGNFALVGHRGHIYGPFFLRLDQVEVGDPILVRSGGATYVYRASEIFVVEPDETWVLDPTEQAQITLITCTPKWINTHRLVVRGVLEAADLPEPVHTAGAS